LGPRSGSRGYPASGGKLKPWKRIKETNDLGKQNLEYAISGSHGG
jgi:hypothetical protein